MSGCWVVFDGPNAAGKSSALRAVATMLRNDGQEVVETREPGGSPLAEQIRALLLDSSNRMDTTTQLCLFNAARRSHLEETIRPNLAAGRIVLCDRFIASSYVFQSLDADGSSNGSDDLILAAHRLFCDDARPDLSIYFEAPLSVRRQRMSLRAGAPADRFEEYDDAFDVAAAAKFQACGRLLDNAYATIDGAADPETVARSAYEVIINHLSNGAARPTSGSQRMETSP
ncbi:dTMP kinase [Sphingosinicella sp. BN140058]|uniref:dTMP kinase n=1 Tax=Sphingosinicella sp. BN140058 TaxID=1892855 RepID=UPI0013EA7805|nr:dTMP kinase [Sphingosinicella sp. BN140058]